MKILFQGDSITYASRNLSDPHDLGQGYPKFAAASIRETFPDVEFEFINQGISGNRTEDVLARLDTDTIDFQPDIVSLLIGINDVWCRIIKMDETGEPMGTEETDKAFEENVTAILEGIKTRTKAKLLVIQPFVLNVGDKRVWREDLIGKQAILNRLVEKYADAYLPMDELFAREIGDVDPAFYSPDGVHPSTEGARVIAKHYLEAVTPLIESLAAVGEPLK